MFAKKPCATIANKYSTYQADKLDLLAIIALRKPTEQVGETIGGGTFFKVAGHKYTSKIIKKLSFELVTVTSQAWKYDVITNKPYKCLNYTILDKIISLPKRIGVPPEVQIGCYRGDPRSLASLGLIIRFILTE